MAIKHNQVCAPLGAFLEELAGADGIPFLREYSKSPTTISARIGSVACGPISTRSVADYSSRGIGYPTYPARVYMLRLLEGLFFPGAYGS